MNTVAMGLRDGLPLNLDSGQLLLPEWLTEEVFSQDRAD